MLGLLRHHADEGEDDYCPPGCGGLVLTTAPIPHAQHTHKVTRQDQAREANVFFVQRLDEGNGYEISVHPSSQLLNLGGINKRLPLGLWVGRLNGLRTSQRGVSFGMKGTQVGLQFSLPTNRKKLSKRLCVACGSDHGQHQRSWQSRKDKRKTKERS